MYVKDVEIVLREGLAHERSMRVGDAHTARAMGSGDLRVFATPAMVAMMEAAALSCVRPYLEEGETTVGSAMEARHLAPTPVGMTVRCVCRLTGVEGRRLTFALEVFDERERVGTASHERFVVRADRFQAKADGK